MQIIYLHFKYIVEMYLCDFIAEQIMQIMSIMQFIYIIQFK